ncbi:hypothetical protein Trydic_g3283 [Trypoxylus dichotomus]
MDNENSQIDNDLDDSLVINEKRLFSSTQIEDSTDYSVIEIKNEIPLVILEETAMSFVVEDTGVIHIRTEKISKMVTPTPSKDTEAKNSKDEFSVVEESSFDNGDLKDGKKEDKDKVVLQKNESTIADVYLQLDVTDNLDTYLERERVRKLNLSKTAKSEKEVILNKTEESLNESEKETSLNETIIQVKKPNVKHSRKESVKKKDENSNAEETDGNNADAAISESKTAEIVKPDAFNAVKSEPNDNDKKDHNRFLWITNVNKTTKATDLKMYLAAFGKVQLAKIVTDGKECFGYVVMESHEDVMNCMENLQNSSFEGKHIVLSDKVPDKKRSEKLNDALKDKDTKKSDKPKKSKSSEQKDGKPGTKSEYNKVSPSDPLTLKVSHSKEKGYLEERRRVEELERKRFIRDRISAERKAFERKRREMERAREKEREKQREHEREVRRRESVRQRLIEIKLEKERKELEYQRKMIEKEKLELLRYKRRLLSKEKENEDIREDHKRRRSPDKYERKKFAKLDDHTPKHSSVEITKEYWKTDSIKTSTHDIYKKNNQEVCVVPPPPILSSNYHATSEAPRSSERDKQWYDRKDFDNRPKSFVRKIEGNRSYNTLNEPRQPYQERSFPKEECKYKDYNVSQQHNAWSGGYSDVPYKEQSIPVLRSEIPRGVHQVRHQVYQENSYGVPPQDYYSGSGYRRVNEYYSRASERKY